MNPSESTSARSNHRSNHRSNLRSNHHLAYFLLTLTALFWAGNWVVGRGIRGDVPPIALSFWRWVVVFVFLVPLAWPYLHSQRALLFKNWRILTLLGLFGGACHNALTYIGLTMTTATNGILLASSTPIMIVTLSWLFFSKRLRAIEWLGVLVSCTGVLVIISHGEWARLIELRPNAGDLWVLAALVFWALYTVLLVKRPVGLHPYASLIFMGVVGMLSLLPFYLWEIATGHYIHFGIAALTAIGYAGIFPALLGLIFWNKAVADIGANKAGLFMHLMPVFGIVLSIIFLGEQPALFHLAGIALILSGITLNTLYGPTKDSAP